MSQSTQDPGEATGQDPKQDPAFIAADTFYFAHLRRMTEQLGQPQAAGALRDMLSLEVMQREPVGRNTMLRMKVCQKLTAYRRRLNATTGETISWYVEFLASGGNTSMPPEEAQALAQKIGEPPPGAVPAGAEYETVGDRTIFRARWEHEHEGVPVEKDYVEVLINGMARRAFAYAKVWRTPDLSGKASER